MAMSAAPPDRAGDAPDRKTPMHRYRSHTCGALSEADIATDVRLSGWCNRIRDHGGVLFIDLRDHYGTTQCVIDPESPAFPAAETLRSEWVVRVDGPVRRRPAGTENADMATGAVEVYARDIEVLGPALELPLPVAGEQDYPEETRLKYRFLDLRRAHLHDNIMLRGRVIDSLRQRMKAFGFSEFQTPILTASSPEGARDYLVPSRVHPGRFYALPQAPQQFKQLIMVAGFDRYFQIAPCFRDEDARADRSPGEFYQLDIEMSFVTQDDVFDTVEPLLRGLFEEFGGGRPVTRRFPRIGYREAMLKYGVDKPDLRNPLEIADVTAEFALPDVTFNAFKAVIAKGGVVRAIPAPGAARQPRSFFDKLNEWARAEGSAGLGYFTYAAEPKPASEEQKAAAKKMFAEVDRPETGSADSQVPEHGQRVETFLALMSDIEGAGPIAKFVPRAVQARIAEKLKLKSGDAVFFAADTEGRAAKLAGAARTRIGRELGLIREGAFEFCWIVDFPMYEFNEDENKIDFSHNPFSMPQGGLEALETKDPLDILAYQYDIVCNGTELSSGAIRNHRPDIMRAAFAIAGYPEEVLEARFGGMYRAFQYGAPPHGGIAPGIDRIVMLLAGEENLREVVLFPMNQRAEDLLMGAPSPASPKQLRELHIRLNLPDK